MIRHHNLSAWACWSAAVAIFGHSGASLSLSVNSFLTWKALAITVQRLTRSVSLQLRSVISLVRRGAPAALLLSSGKRNKKSLTATYIVLMGRKTEIKEKEWGKEKKGKNEGKKERHRKSRMKEKTLLGEKKVFNPIKPTVSCLISKCLRLLIYQHD